MVQPLCRGNWQHLVNLKTPVLYNMALLKLKVQVHGQLRAGPGSVHQTICLSNQGVHPVW